MTALTVLLLGSGCGLDENFRDLGEELFAPGIGYIETPGTQLAAGDIHRFSLRAPDFDQRYITAIRGRDELVLIEFGGDGALCSVGTAKAYGNTFPTLDANGRAARERLIPYQVSRNGEGRGELRFTRFNCETLSVRVDDVPLPRDVLVSEENVFFILRNSDRDLLAVDPWADEVRLIARDVRLAMVQGNDKLWTIEGGEAVVRSASLEVAGRFGSKVTELRVGRGRIVDWAAILDDGNLYFDDSSALQDPVLVDRGACQVQQVGSSEDQFLRYFRPCNTRRLILLDAETNVRAEYVTDVITTSVVWRSTAGFDLNYWTGPEGASVGTLWIALAGEEPVKVADDTLIDPNILFRSVATTIIDYDGSTGTYAYWEDGETTPIAEGVIEVNGLGVLANYQDGVGDLLRVNGLSTKKLASGVPRRATRGRAFIANAEHGRGDLMVIEELGKPRKIADGATGSSFFFSEQIQTLMVFLSDVEDDHATLQVRLLDTGDQLEISEGVSEILEVSFPRPGILYNVVTGERQGLWFASVR